jgi:hypothetical protein
MDIITSDIAIALFAFAGLTATAVSIVRDTRSQRQTATIHALPMSSEPTERVAA